MERQFEYELRKSIQKTTNDKINKALDEYYDKFKDNLGFLLYYPLIVLEREFIDAGMEAIRIQPRRVAVCWFIKEMMKRGYENIENDTLSQDKYDSFINYYPEIIKLYFDYHLATNIMDMRSTGRIIVEEQADGVYRIGRPIIENAYEGYDIYYTGSHDPKQMEKEISFELHLKQYLIDAYDPRNRSNYSTVKHLDRNVDIDFLKLCIQKAGNEIDKIGAGIESKAIGVMEEYKCIIGFLYYLAQVWCHLNFFVTKGVSDINDQIVTIDKNWVINKMVKILNANVQGVSLTTAKVENFIEYLTIDPNKMGTVNEFPLISYKDKLIMIPSSLLLNDLHFSLANGHYFKSIQFSNRDDTMSESIAEEIVKNVKSFTNIVPIMTYKYSFKNELGEIECGDIDAALYDFKSNTLLLIECKWKDNTFKPLENYTNIADALAKLHNNQLMKHKDFINGRKEIVNEIFNNDPRIIAIKDFPEICYIGIDKRCQLHNGDEHLFAIYALLAMINDNSDGNQLNLDLIVNDIKHAETVVKYLEAEDIYMLSEKFFNDSLKVGPGKVSPKFNHEIFRTEQFIKITEKIKLTGDVPFLRYNI